MEPEVRMTTAEVARLAGVNPKTIRRWISNGTIEPAQPTAFDITPLLQRLEELSRENEQLRNQLTPPVPWWQRLQFWKGHTHAPSDKAPPALPPER